MLKIKVEGLGAGAAETTTLHIATLHNYKKQFFF
jgi:hypothetical protein